MGFHSSSPALRRAIRLTSTKYSAAQPVLGVEVDPLPVGSFEVDKRYVKAGGLDSGEFHVGVPPIGAAGQVCPSRSVLTSLGPYGEKVETPREPRERIGIARPTPCRLLVIVPLLGNSVRGDVPDVLRFVAVSEFRQPTENPGIVNVGEPLREFEYGRPTNVGISIP